MIGSLPREARGPFAAFAALGVLWGAWAALLPAVQHEVGASKGELGLALLAVGVGALPAMLLAGRLADRHAHRMLPAALVALAAAALLPGLAGSVTSLAACLLVVGACSGTVDVAMNAAAAGVERATGRRVMQLAHALFSAGLLAGAVAAGAAREAGAGVRPVLAGVAVACLAAAALRPAAAGDGPAATPGPRRRVRVGRHVLVLGALGAGAFLVESGMESWSALYLERDLDATPGVAALGPAAYALAMVAGRLGGHLATGRLADRRLLAGGALVSGAALAVAAAAPTVPVAVPAFFVAGLGVSVAAPAVFAAAGRSSPEHAGSAVSAMTAIGYLAFLAGPPLVGGVAEAAGLRASFALLAGVSVLLAAAASRVRL